MPLIDKQVGNAQYSQGGTGNRLSDGGRMYLQIDKSGAKYWRMNYRFAGKGFELQSLFDNFYRQFEKRILQRSEAEKQERIQNRREISENLPVDYFTRLLPGATVPCTSPANDLPAHIKSLEALVGAPCEQGQRYLKYLESGDEVDIFGLYTEHNNYAMHADEISNNWTQAIFRSASAKALLHYSTATPSKPFPSSDAVSPL
jgi:hypothetical protein